MSGGQAASEEVSRPTKISDGGLLMEKVDTFIFDCDGVIW
jgi:hypothetical protein